MHIHLSQSNIRIGIYSYPCITIYERVSRGCQTLEFMLNKIIMHISIWWIFESKYKIHYR